MFFGNMYNDLCQVVHFWWGRSLVNIQKAYILPELQVERYFESCFVKLN